MGLNENGIRSEITWLPKRAEFLPWSVAIPKPPSWANIVHTNTWIHSRFIPKHLPLVTTIHHAIHHLDVAQYKGFLRRLYHKHWIIPLEKETILRAKKVVAVSHFAAETAKRTIVDVPIGVIYNGIDTNIFKPKTRIKQCKKPFRILYLGSWKLLKGVNLLTPIIKELGKDFELYYTGSLSSSDKEIARLPNAHNIGYIKSEESIAETMNDCDALILPSRSEGFGLVAVEAMACGLPVVASNGSSLSEIIQQDKNGCLCEKDNISDFVKSIRRLAENRRLYQNICIESERVAKNKFSHHTMIKNYISECYFKI
nr:glycosyltransferase family 4 protein [Marinobacter xestospongiae]